jgi:hypothetical protein
VGAELLILGILPLVPPLPGDVDSAPVAASACTINPYTNDVFGHTDKLVTHAVGVACGGGLETLLGNNNGIDQTGFSTSLNWRMVTPIYKTSREAKTLDQPVGNFADWIEFQNGLARSFRLGTQDGYAQLSFSLHDISPKGGEEIQNNAHRIFGLKSRYAWKDQIRLQTVGGNLESGITLRIGSSENWALRSGLGWNDSPLLSEFYAINRLSWTQSGESPSSESGFNSATATLMAARPQSSKILPLAHHTRYSLSFTARYMNHFYSAISISTPYAQADTFRQIALTPLGLVFDL